jgi:hypothetical protein
MKKMIKSLLFTAFLAAVIVLHATGQRQTMQLRSNEGNRPVNGNVLSVAPKRRNLQASSRRHLELFYRLSITDALTYYNTNHSGILETRIVPNSLFLMEISLTLFHPAKTQTTKETTCLATKVKTFASPLQATT